MSLVLTEALLLQHIPRLNAPEAWPVEIIHPVVQVGGAALLVIAAYRTAGSRRWAWRLLAFAFFLSTIATLWNMERRWQERADVLPEIQWLFLVSYGVGLLGTALVFPRSWWRDGSIVRLLLDSALVTFAAMILLNYGLPLGLRTWTWTERLHFLVPFLGLDVGMLFALTVCCARLGRRASVLSVPVMLGMFCFLLGECLSLVVYHAPGGEQLALAVGPLYGLHSVLVALGAYRSPLEPVLMEERVPTVTPLFEWVLWSIVPRVFFFAAIAMIALVPQAFPSQSARIALLIVAGLREGMAIYDQRRVQRALHTAQAEASQAARQTNDFLSRVVHDLAAPLCGMRIALLTLSDETLRSQFTHLDRLYTQLHSYLRARTATLELTALDVLPVCEAALHAAMEGAAVRQARLSFVLDTDATRVLANATAVRRVLDNLLTNAVNVSPPNGEVVLSISAAPTDSRLLLITVCDEGPGIPPDQTERIFAPLVRLHSGSGLGLGLSIMQELVHQMNGRCGVWSVEGAGSTFWVELPRA